MSTCNHDQRFHLMGAKNGCCACQLEAAADEIERLRAALAWLDDYVLDVGGCHNGERAVKKIQKQQSEIERLRAALQKANAEAIEACDRAAEDANAANDMMQERDACRALLRELCIAWDNNPQDMSSDKRLRLIPIMEPFIEAASAAGGGE